jgi:hypothetical protein
MKSFLHSLTFIVALLAQTTFGQTPADQVIEYLKPTLDTQTVAVLNVDLARLDMETFEQQLSAHISEPTPAKLVQQQIQQYASAYSAIEEAGASELNVVYRIGPLKTENRLVALKCENEAASQKVVEALKDFPGIFGVQADIRFRDDLVVIGTSENIGISWTKAAVNPPNWYTLHDEAELKALSHSLQSAGDSPVRFGLTISADQKRALVEFGPKTIAADPQSSIENLTSLSAGIDPTKQSIRVQLETATPESAVAFATQLTNSFLGVARLPALQANLPGLAKWLGSVSFERSDSRLNWTMENDAYTSALQGIASPIAQSFKRQRYSQSISKLREIMIALHNYHDANGQFPPAFSTNDENRPLLSWRVQILPYLGQLQLYRQFKLDEPWDSEANRKAAKTIPAIYSGGLGDELGTQTRFVAPFGATALAADPIRLQDIADGSSNTIAVVEVSPSQAVDWAKPDKFSIDHDNLKSLLIEEGDSGFWAGFSDASIHFVPSEVNEDDLKNLMLTSDGNEVKLEGIRIQLPMANQPATPRPDPNYDVLNELPEFWFKQLIPSPWIVSGLTGG